jgi:hypothetical protein
LWKDCSMRTLQIKINDKIYDKFVWLISKFSKDEVEIISESQDFLATKEYLQKELDEIERGEANFISQEEFEERMNKIS